MTAAFYVIGTLVIAAVLYFALRKPVREYFAVRGDRVVTCPDNNQTVAVRVDAAFAARTAASGREELRLETCSRWPEKAGCGQECLAQIETQADGCLVRTQVTRWYTDKTCVCCGKALGLIDWTQRKPALRRPDGTTVEWADIKVESLPDVFATHAAICWNCHVAETFRRERPDLVIDDPGTGGTRH